MNRRVFLADGALAVALGAAAGGRARCAAATADVVAVSHFGADAAALVRAIASGAREVVIDREVMIAAPVELRSNQTLRFAGGRLILAGDAESTQAMLFSNGGSDIAIVAPVIDGRRRGTGLAGIKLVDVTDARIAGGKLIGANLWLESKDNAIPRGISVDHLTIDMAGARQPAVYLSGVNGVTIRDSSCRGGLEGIGIYNGACDIVLDTVNAFEHAQDGFVIIDGRRISFRDCVGKANGQSGFCTQDLRPCTGARDVTWSRCVATGNAADGFDLHGFKGVERSNFRLESCEARANGPTNGGCGYYIVTAPGTVMIECAAIDNCFQGLLANGSDGLTTTGFRSISNAGKIASGPNKAGILIYDSDNVSLGVAVSRNAQGAAQDYGVSFTGHSKRAIMMRGDLGGNRVSTLFARPGVILRVLDAPPTR